MIPRSPPKASADRLKALAARYSREDLLRAFDLLARAEGEIRYSSQPRHHFEMALVEVDPAPQARAARRI